jgi:hypothetical protein
MKNIFTVLIYFALVLKLEAQHIVDSNFADAIRWACPTCIDTAQNLTSSAHSLKGLTMTNHITDLTGLEGFSSLTLLNVSDNDLTTITYLPSNLITFHCANNRLTQLPNLPPSILYLKCSGNKLTSLPTLPPRLQLLECSRNALTVLPILPNTLLNFYCSYNNIANLPFLPYSIIDMGCADNKLTTIPNIPPNLILLSCFSNPLLKCLPTLPPKLLYLELSNTITCLPNAVTGLTVYRYEASVFNTVSLPICTSIIPNPCGSATGISDNLAEKIRIYPNFTEGVLHIESDNLVVENITIFNEMGQALMQTKDLNVDISKFSSGVYFVELLVTEGKIMKKVVKL